MGAFLTNVSRNLQPQRQGHQGVRHGLCRMHWSLHAHATGVCCPTWQRMPRRTRENTGLSWSPMPPLRHLHITVRALNARARDGTASPQAAPLHVRRDGHRNRQLDGHQHLAADDGQGQVGALADEVLFNKRGLLVGVVLCAGAGREDAHRHRGDDARRRHKPVLRPQAMRMVERASGAGSPRVRVVPPIVQLVRLCHRSCGAAVETLQRRYSRRAGASHASLLRQWRTYP